MEALVVAPEGVPDPRKRERPDGRADRREPEIRPERHLEDAGRGRDERGPERRAPGAWWAAAWRRAGRLWRRSRPGPPPGRATGGGGQGRRTSKSAPPP